MFLIGWLRAPSASRRSVHGVRKGVARQVQTAARGGTRQGAVRNVQTATRRN